MDNNYRKYEQYLTPWKIDRVIGEGGFGTVFEISREDYGYTYKAALKAITIPQTKSEVTSIMADGMDKVSVTDYYRTFVNEIMKECAMMSRFKGDSNIVSYEDHKVVEHTDDISWDIFIRMELLTPMLKYEQENKMTEQDVAKLGIDVCRALELCEKYNVIHRDIKPENIFISETGNFKLGDFGIARTIEKTTGGLSKTGTTSYMAPEVYKGEDYGFTVDIYSLGTVMYRCLNNRRTPFLPPAPQPITYRERENARMRRMKGEELPPPCNCSAKLANIVLKACSYSSADRFRSATEMRQALEHLIRIEDEDVDLPQLITEDIKTARSSIAKEVNVGVESDLNDIDEAKTISPFMDIPIKRANNAISPLANAEESEEDKTVSAYSGFSKVDDEKTISPFMDTSTQQDENGINQGLTADAKLLDNNQEKIIREHPVKSNNQHQIRQQPMKLFDDIDNYDEELKKMKENGVAVVKQDKSTPVYRYIPNNNEKLKLAKLSEESNLFSGIDEYDEELKKMRESNYKP